MRDKQKERSLSFFFTFLRPYKWYFIALILITPVITFINIFYAYLAQRLIDTTIAGEKELMIKILYAIVIVIVIDLVVSSLGQFLSKYGLSLTRDIRNMICGQYQRVKVQFLEQKDSGEYVTLLNSDAEKVSDFITSIPNTIYQPLVFISVFVYLFTINWVLLMTTVIILPLSSYIMGKVLLPVTSYTNQVQEKVSKTNTLVKETIYGMNIVKSYSLAAIFRKKFLKIEDSLMDIRMKLLKITGLHQYRINTTLITVPQFICIIVGGFFMVNGDMTIGQFMAYQSLTYYLTDPLMKMNNFFSEYKQTKASSQRLNALLQEPLEDGDEAAPFQRKDSSDAVQIQDMTFYYNESSPVLDRIQLSIPPKKTIAVVGFSGNGKTTLLNLIMRFYSPIKGAISIYGNDVNQTEIHSLRKQMVYMSQETYIYNTTVLENVRYGRADATREEIISVCRMAQVDSFVSKMENSYDTVLEENGSNLSGGERQRIGLARLLLSDADIVLMDEPTSALDTITENAIMRNIQDLNHKKTMVIIAHRISTIQHSDEIFVIDNHQIAAHGSHQELLEDCEVYQKLCQNQIQ